jgi:hypothetical protein
MPSPTAVEGRAACGPLAGTFALVACLLRGPHDLADEALRSLGAPIAVTDAAGARAEVVVPVVMAANVFADPGMAPATLKSLAFQAKAPAAQTGWMSKISNPTNHMRPAGGGAFILQSMVGASLRLRLHSSRARNCERVRRRAIWLTAIESCRRCTQTALRIRRER